MASIEKQFRINLKADQLNSRDIRYLRAAGAIGLGIVLFGLCLSFVAFEERSHAIFINQSDLRGSIQASE